MYSPSADVQVSPWSWIDIRGGWEADVVSGASVATKAGGVYGAAHNADVVTAASVHDFRNVGHGEIELKEPLKKSLSVKNFATEPIKLTGVESSAKGIEAKIEPLTEGREYTIRVTLDPSLGKGPFHGKLTLHTDSAKMPQLDVELKGTVL